MQEDQHFHYNGVSIPAMAECAATNALVRACLRLGYTPEQIVGVLCLSSIEMQRRFANVSKITLELCTNDKSAEWTVSPDHPALVKREHRVTWVREAMEVYLRRPVSQAEAEEAYRALTNAPDSFDDYMKSAFGSEMKEG